MPWMLKNFRPCHWYLFVVWTLQECQYLGKRLLRAERKTQCLSPSNAIGALIETLSLDSPAKASIPRFLSSLCHRRSSNDDRVRLFLHPGFRHSVLHPRLRNAVDYPRLRNAIDHSRLRNAIVKSGLRQFALLDSFLVSDSAAATFFVLTNSADWLWFANSFRCIATATGCSSFDQLAADQSDGSCGPSPFLSRRPRHSSKFSSSPLVIETPDFPLLLLHLCLCIGFNFPSVLLFISGYSWCLQSGPRKH